MSKQLLVDTLNIRLNVSESSGGGKTVARGQFALADAKTANGRVYPRKLWERELNRLSKAISERKVLGEADHPSDGMTKLSRASHLITGLELQDDGQVVGVAEVMDTSAGKEIKAILNSGASIGVSSRGYGSVQMNENGDQVVQEDFQLDTFDFVVNPAQATAYPEFTTESAAMLTDKGKVQETLEVANQTPAVAAEEEKKECEDKKDGEGQEMVTAESFEAMRQSLIKEFSAKLQDAVAESKKLARQEVMSELMSDPAVAGAKAALESVKATLRPFIMPKDMNAALESKEVEMAKLAEHCGVLEGKIREMEQNSKALSEAVKDLGYSLYLERNLGGHPKFKEIVKSLGNLSKIETIAALKDRVKLYESEVKSLNESRLSSSKNAMAAKEAEIARLQEQAQKLFASNKRLVQERDQAVELGKEAAVQVYLERKIVGNANASLIRTKFESMKIRNKDSVDQLVESFSPPKPRQGAGDFDAIRRRFGKGKSSIVEDSLKGTVRSRESVTEEVEIGEGVSVNMSEFAALSGVKSTM